MVLAKQQQVVGMWLQVASLRFRVADLQHFLSNLYMNFGFVEEWRLREMILATKCGQ
jgi:hypothetical protein